MSSKGTILLADDEPTFLQATADLLRREGYDSVTVQDAAGALDQIGRRQFDLLVTDLEMPGNEDLDLVRQVAQKSGGLPVIIITGYPSVRSAISCVELPVAAYLTKPVDFPVFMDKIRAAVSRFRSYQAMQRTESRLKEWREEMVSTSVDQKGSTLDVFLALTLRNVMGSLNDLEQLSRALNQTAVEQHPCQLFNCPRGSQLVEAVKSTIAVLEETKGSFKSKSLGDLRHRLELLLEHV
jgi:DNA-binding response OmpR family regulator